MPPSGPLPHASAPALATIAALARPGDLRALPIVVAELVMALRVVAIYERAGHDPVADLARRYRNIEAAAAIHTMVRTVARCWPDPVMVNRPCCAHLTPDEATIAAMAKSARNGDRGGFVGQLDGFVRADRHDSLYRAVLHAVALLPSVG